MLYDIVVLFEFFALTFLHVAHYTSTRRRKRENMRHCMTLRTFAVYVAAAAAAVAGPADINIYSR